MKPINDLLATHGVPVYDPDDATLSSGEHAQAIIVAAPLLAAAESSMCPDVEVPTYRSRYPGVFGECCASWRPIAFDFSVR